MGIVFFLKRLRGSNSERTISPFEMKTTISIAIPEVIPKVVINAFIVGTGSNSLPIPDI